MASIGIVIDPTPRASRAPADIGRDGEHVQNVPRKVAARRRGRPAVPVPKAPAEFHDERLELMAGKQPEIVVRRVLRGYLGAHRPGPVTAGPRELFARGEKVAEKPLVGPRSRPVARLACSPHISVERHLARHGRYPAIAEPATA